MFRTPSVRRACARTLPFALLLLAMACKDTSAPASSLTITPDQAELVIGATRQFTALGASGAVSWSSGNTSVADVVAVTGFVTAVGRGSTTITATSGASSASAQVNVLAPATLALSAAAVDFDMVVGGAAPGAQTVTVTNAGDVALPEITLGATQYGAGQPTGWLAVSAGGTAAPVTLTFSVQPGALSHGTYTAVVPVLAAGVANSPQHVAVTFRLQRPPLITVSPAVIELTGIPGVTVEQSIQVGNGGDLPLTGLSAAVTYGGGATGWLTATLGAPTAPTSLQLAANTTGLTPATYTANVRLTSSLAGVAHVDVPVTLVVTTGPTLQLSQTVIDINAVFGENPAPAQVAITNSGGGTVAGLAIGTLTYTGGSPGWLSTSLSGSTAPATLTLNVAASQLPSGSYSAMVPVTSTTADNSPVTLTVNLSVGPLPVIAVSPASVAFASWSGAHRPGPQVVQVTNAEAGALTGLSASVQYTTGTGGWLDFGLSQTTAPAQLVLQPSTTSLPAGQYQAVVTIQSSMPGVESKSVTVTYDLQSFTAHVYPGFSAAGCSGCHAMFNGTAQQVYNAASGYVVPGNPAGSPVYCKPFGSCTHGGGKFNDTHAWFGAALAGWISAGAPFH